MDRCIFCEAVLGPSTKPEHILLDALGGRKTTKRAICSDHNQTFGSTIDKGLADQVAAFRNLFGLESGTGKTAPALRTTNQLGERLILPANGRPELLQKPFVITRRSDGTAEIQINARDEGDIVRITPHIAATLGISETEVWALIEGAVGRRVSRRAGPVHHQLSLGGELSLRAICKAALCLTASRFGSAPLRSVVFDDVRRFVLSGDPDFSAGRVSLDSRPLPGAEHLEANFGPLFNFLYVRSDAAGRVVAHFTLYNLIAWQAVLAEAGGPPDVCLGLACNPLAPSVWSDVIADELDISCDWLDTPDRDKSPEAAQRRFSNALAIWADRAQRDLIEDVMKRAFAREGVDDGSLITQAALSELASELSHHLLDIPYELPFSSEDLSRLRDKSGS